MVRRYKRKMRGLALGGIIGRIGAEVAKRGGARAVAKAGAAQIARDQGKVQAQKGLFRGIQAIQDRNIAKIAAGRVAFVDDYTSRMNAARDRGDMREYMRLWRESDKARDAGRNPMRGVRKGGFIYNSNLQW